MVIDPHYVTAPAVFLKHTTMMLTGYMVVIDHALRRGVMKIDHDLKVIRVRTGLGLDNYNWLLWRATVRLLWGKEWAPEFIERPKRPALRLVRSPVAHPPHQADDLVKLGPATVPFQLPSEAEQTDTECNIGNVRSYL